MVDLPQSVWLPALVAFIAVALGTISLVLVWEWMREQARRRDMVSQLKKLANDPLEESDSPVFRNAARQASWVDPMIARVPQLKDAAFMILQAGMEWTVGTLVTLSLGFGIGFGLLTLIFTRSIFPALAAAAFGASLPTLYVNQRRKKRLAAFEEMLPESIDLIGRALRAGHPLSAGFKMAADDGAEPVAGELRRVFEESRFGLPVQDCLLGMADRVNLIDVRILVTAILIQREVGGNLAEILDNLAHVIRARFTIRRQIKVYTAQGRMTGYLLAALPIILFFLLYSLNPEYMSILWTDSMGRFLVGFALTMQFIGFLWIRKIINIEI